MKAFRKGHRFLRSLPTFMRLRLHFWAHQWRHRHARGQVVIVRFADDAVVGFEYRQDAERFHAELRRRLSKFNLELAAEKTRLIEFGRFAARDRQRRDLGKPETFRFLGFTHICGKTRGGRFQLKRITDSKRIPAKLAVLRGKIERRQHLPDLSSRDAGSPAPCKGTTSTTRCPTTSRRSTPSVNRPSGTGAWRFGAAASARQ